MRSAAGRNLAAHEKDFSLRQLSILGNLLTVVSPTRASDIATRLLGEFETLGGVFSAPCERLNEIAGDNGQVSYLIAIAQRAVRETMRERVYRSRVSSGDRNFLKYLTARIGLRSDEAFLVVFLDGSDRFLREELISIGSGSSVDVKVGSVLRPAVQYGARGIIMAHNHPNGDPNPSQTDVSSTLSIKQISSCVGVELIDHLIVTRSTCFSMKSSGLI